MKIFKATMISIFLVLCFALTVLSAAFLAHNSFLYVYYNSDTDINQLTASFYLTFGLTLFTTVASLYVYIFQEELERDMRMFKKE